MEKPEDPNCVLDPTNDVVDRVVQAWGSCGQSPVSAIFGAQDVRLAMCRKDSCQYETMKVDLLMVVTLPLPDKPSCTLKECFQLYCEEELLRCGQCTQPKSEEVHLRLRLKLGKLPPVLVVHLSRFMRLQDGRTMKKNCNVEYGHDLDISEFIVEGLQSNCKYELYAVTEHTGTLDSGHVTAFCRRGSR